MTVTLIYDIGTEYNSDEASHDKSTGLDLENLICVAVLLVNSQFA